MSARNLAFFGDSALYTDVSSGEETSMTVWLEEQLETLVNGYTANVWEQVFTIEIMLSDVESEPDIGDTFLIGDNLFRVHSVLENNGTTCKMAVLKKRES
jgi:hypothetical protein